MDGLSHIPPPTLARNTAAPDEMARINRPVAVHDAETAWSQTAHPQPGAWHERILYAVRGPTTGAGGRDVQEPPGYRRSDAAGASSSRFNAAPCTGRSYKRGRSPSASDDEHGAAPRSTRLKPAHYFSIALIMLLEKASRIRLEDARYLNIVNLTPEVIEHEELQRLQVDGMTRWVRLTLSGVIFHYVMVMNPAHSPPRTFLNTIPALVAGVRIGPSNNILFGCGWEVRSFVSASEPHVTWVS